ncbi:hypothetical protein A0H81_07196 [Grifola frondosa]|uniref:Uncharacterized protein n=1 Tax=Grifola frondosa TaxID=5627 RepID=A0A1C7M8R3_GRIFR|nr:hypothetical protein A0H81_07196 [Grifola frondosa]
MDLVNSGDFLAAREHTPGNIIGIILHVDECGEQPLETLTYYKSRTRAIAIGRSCEPQACKDHLYGVWECIHHGLELPPRYSCVKTRDLVSTAIKPEVPTVLADGDVITFGKSVGRDEFLVRPITVRVKLVVGTGSSPRPSFVDLVTPEPEEKTSPRSSTGRYGVFIPSSESSASTSDESDIQEISPPSSPRASAQAIHPFFLSLAESHSNRLQLLRRLLPPVDFPPIHSSTISASSDDSSFASGHAQMPSNGGDLGPVSLGPDDDVLMILSDPIPHVIGAWPGSPTRPGLEDHLSSNPPSPESNEVAILGNDRISSVEAIAPASRERSASDASDDVEIIDCVRLNDGNNILVACASPDLEQQPAHRGDECPVANSERASPAPDSDLSGIQAEIRDACSEITLLRVARLKSETRFDEHVLEMKRKLAAVDQDMFGTNSRITAAIAANDAHMTSVRSRLDHLREDVDYLQSKSINTDYVKEQSSAVSDGVAAMKDMLEEMRSLRNDTGRQIAEELEAIRALRAAAEAAQAQTVTTSLKRKRSESEGESSAEGISSTTNCDSSKRRKTAEVAAKIAQTATIATMGAVAAWTALAFS